jgi:four helix bundle protein
MLNLPYQKLLVWQKAMEIAQDIYVLTDALPRKEQYALISQMQRAAVPIPSNIAEGSQRSTNKEFYHFISIAKGSLAELETQCMLSKNIGYGSGDEWDRALRKCQELQR